jgi:hypothetical protein
VALPFLHGAVEAKKVLYPLPDGKDLSPIRAIEIDEEKLISCHEDVLELKVSVKEPCLVKVSKENPSGSDGFSF